MDQRARDVIALGDALFAKKRLVDQLMQEIALNFYPERADFTARRSEGAEFASHLFSSYPVLARRELGNLFASNLRPRASKWFSTHARDEALDKGTEERRYLEYLTDVQWRAMYDAAAQFVRATKEADHDFAAFGNAVIKVGPNLAGDGLLFSCHHLRDNVWSENAEGTIDANHRNWNPTARQLKEHFADKVSREVTKAAEKEPEKEFACRHVVLPAPLYDMVSMNRRLPYVSLYVERDSETVLEEVGLNYFPYVIPRWQTVSGSPFGRSMATSIALSDGRTMQVVVRVLREAGEKFVDPPMIGVEGALRSDIALYPGGITFADIEYDERLGEVLRPVAQDRSGMPIGLEIAQALREDLSSAFFLDKIKLPEVGPDMTATEVRRRIEEHIRAASPLFEPIEQEYNTPLCELAFHILREGGAFGSVEAMPATLRGSEIQFTFRSPVSDMADQNDAAIFVEGLASVIQPAAQFDPAQLENVDLTEGVRDSLRGLGWKSHWLKDKAAVGARRAELEREAMIQKGMGALHEAAALAEQGGKGAQAIVKTDEA
jgi:hypothetical protein